MIFTFQPAHAQQSTTESIHDSNHELFFDTSNNNRCDEVPDAVNTHTFWPESNFVGMHISTSTADCSRALLTFDTDSILPDYTYEITNLTLNIRWQDVVQDGTTNTFNWNVVNYPAYIGNQNTKWALIPTGTTAATITTSTQTAIWKTTSHVITGTALSEAKQDIENGQIAFGVYLSDDINHRTVQSYVGIGLGDLQSGQSAQRGHTTLDITFQEIVQARPPTNFDTTSQTQQALTFTWTPPTELPDNYQLNITNHNNVTETHTIDGSESSYSLTYDPYLSCEAGHNINAAIRSFNIDSHNRSHYSAAVSLSFVPTCLTYYSSHIEKGPPPTGTGFTYRDDPERYAPLTMTEVQGGDVLVTMSADEYAAQYDYTLYSCSGIDYPILDRLPLFPFIANEQTIQYTSVGLGQYIKDTQTPALIDYTQTCSNTRYCSFQSQIHYGETRLNNDLTLDGLITDVRATYTISASGQQYSRDQIHVDAAFRNSSNNIIHTYQGRTTGAADATINIESEYDRDITIATSYGRNGDWGHKPQQYQGSSGLITSPLSIFDENVGGNLLKRSYTQNSGLVNDDVEKGDVLVIMGYNYSTVSTAPLTEIGYTEFQGQFNQSAEHAKLTVYYVQSDRDATDLVQVDGSIHGYLIKPLYDLNALRHLEHGIIIPEYMLTEHSSLTCSAKKHVLHQDNVVSHTTIAHTIEYEHPAAQCVSTVHNMPNTPLTRAFNIQYEDILPDNHCSVLGNAIDRKTFVSPVPPSDIENIGNFSQFDGTHPQPDILHYYGEHRTDTLKGSIVFNPNKGLDFSTRAHVYTCDVTDPISGFTTTANQNAGTSETGWCTGHDYNYCHSITVCQKDAWGSRGCNESSGQAPYWFTDRQLTYTCHDINGRSLNVNGVIEPAEPFYESVITEINTGTALGWGGSSTGNSPFMGIGILGALGLLSGMAAFSRWNIIASIIIFIVLITALSFLGFLTLTEAALGAVIVFAVLGIMGRMFR